MVAAISNVLNWFGLTTKSVNQLWFSTAAALALASVSQMWFYAAVLLTLSVLTGCEQGDGGGGD